MDLADLDADLPDLTPAQRAHLEKAMQNTEPFQDPELMERLALEREAIEAGAPVISKEEFFQRLRAAGREV